MWALSFSFTILIPNLTAYENVDMARKISGSQMKTEERWRPWALDTG